MGKKSCLFLSQMHRPMAASSQFEEEKPWKHMEIYFPVYLSIWYIMNWLVRTKPVGSKMKVRQLWKQFCVSDCSRSINYQNVILEIRKCQNGVWILQRNKSRDRRPRIDRQRIQKENRQKIKEKRSGLFVQEEILAVSSSNMEEEIDVLGWRWPLIGRLG